MKLWLPQQTLFPSLLSLPLGPRPQPSTETVSHAFFLSILSPSLSSPLPYSSIQRECVTEFEIECPSFKDHG